MIFSGAVGCGVIDRIWGSLEESEGKALVVSTPTVSNGNAFFKGLVGTRERSS